jgi:hypothetical protein
MQKQRGDFFATAPSAGRITRSSHQVGPTHKAKCSLYENAIYRTVKDQFISKCVVCCKSYVYCSNSRSTVYNRKSTFSRN